MREKEREKEGESVKIVKVKERFKQFLAGIQCSYKNRGRELKFECT